MRYVRRYFDDRDGNYDPFKTKSWQAMFSTMDPEVAERKAIEAGFRYKWEGNRVGTLTLIHEMNATRSHPVTGDVIWHNHINVLEVMAEPAEFAFSAQHLRSWKYMLIHYCHEALVLFQHLYYAGDSDRFGHHATHRNGSEIAAEDIHHVRRPPAAAPGLACRAGAYNREFSRVDPLCVADLGV